MRLLLAHILRYIINFCLWLYYNFKYKEEYSKWGFDNLGTYLINQKGFKKYTSLHFQRKKQYKHLSYAENIYFILGKNLDLLKEKPKKKEDI